VTHDSRVLSFADRIIRIEDGLIADNSMAGDSVTKKRPESEVSAELLAPSTTQASAIHIA
jgi:ABC-type lipoprotein export system ATPase subunit